MKNIICQFKSRTANGRIAVTRIIKAIAPPGESDIFIIKQRILAKPGDYYNGWFKNHRTLIRSSQNYSLVENEMVFWKESFEAMMEAYNKLIEK